MKTETIVVELLRWLGPGPKEALRATKGNLLMAYALIVICWIHLAILSLAGLSLYAYIFHDVTVSPLAYILAVCTFVSYNTLIHLTTLASDAAK